MSIQEFPLDEVAVEAEPSPPDAQAESQSNLQFEKQAPKKRGRPAGAKNKPKEILKAAPPKAEPAPVKAKPRPKKKAPVYEETSSSEEESQVAAPRQRRQRSVPAQQPMDTRSLAADVLDLLQSQRMSRTMQRRNHYASFFKNM